MGVASTLISSAAENRLITAVSLIVGLITYIFLLYPFYLSPLKKVPGPYLYKISKIFILNDQRTEQRNVKLNKLHAKYGSVVQVGPTEISLGSFDYLREVYIKKNLPKSQFYGQFVNFGQPNAFSLLDSSDHIKRKKLMSKIYTKTAIFNPRSQAHVNEKVNDLLTFVKGRIGLPMDVYELFNSLAMDVVTYYELGSKFSTNLLLNMEDREIIKSFRASSSTWFWTTLVPQLWDYVVDNDTQTLSANCANWTKSKFLEAYEDLEKNGAPEDEMSLVKTLYENNANKWAIGSEVFDHVAAGHETTGSSLAFATWELSRPFNSYMQDELYKEMCDNFGTTPLDFIDLETLDRLEYLNAFILEVARLHAAIPGSEPRQITKANSFHVELADGTKVDLPEGTVVSVQPWTIHNDAAIFARPEIFKPERWLKQENETDSEFKQRFQGMRNRLFTFGHGNRMCLGMNIAMIEMKLTIAQLYWRFNSQISRTWCTKLSEDPAVMGYSTFDLKKSKRELTDVELMSMADSYTSRPMFDECWLEWASR
jgi:unspecific monooxygenase